jgi:hypothetical protein
MRLWHDCCPSSNHALYFRFVVHTCLHCNTIIQMSMLVYAKRCYISICTGSRKLYQYLHTWIWLPYVLILPRHLQLYDIVWNQLSQFRAYSQFNGLTNFLFLVSTENWDCGLSQFNDYALWVHIINIPLLLVLLFPLCHKPQICVQVCQILYPFRL